MSLAIASEGRVKPTKQITMRFVGPTTRRDVLVDIYWGDDLQSRFEKEIQAAQSIFECIGFSQLTYYLEVIRLGEEKFTTWTDSLGALIRTFVSSFSRQYVTIDTDAVRTLLDGTTNKMGYTYYQPYHCEALGDVQREGHVNAKSSR